MFKQIVEAEFFKVVDQSAYASPELKRTIRKHPRTNGFIESLATELQKANTLNVQRGVKVKLETVKGFIRDMTDHWLFMIEENARQRQLSDIARKAEEQAIDEKLNPEKNIRAMGIETDDESIQEEPRIH